MIATGYMLCLRKRICSEESSHFVFGTLYDFLLACDNFAFITIHLYFILSVA
jgi:hypothetical protein